MKAICAVLFCLFCAVRMYAAEVAILVYHDFVPDDAVCGAYTVTASRFAEQLDALATAGYTGVDYDDLIAYVDGVRDWPEKAVLLSVDDGYTGVCTVAAPIARAHGMPLSVAVIGSRMGDGVHFSPEDAAEWDNLTLVSHSYDLHRDGGVPSFSEEEIRTDAAKMHAYGAVFVYPYGAYTAETDALLADCGYRVTVTCDAGIVHIPRGGELFALPRIAVWESMTGEELLGRIAGFETNRE